MLLLCCVCALISTFSCYPMEKKIKVILTTNKKQKINVIITDLKKFTKEQKQQLTPKNIEKFHQLLESGNLDRAQELLEKNIWLATVPRAFINEVPLVTLLKTMIKEKPDNNELQQYISIAIKIIKYNILINKNYKLNSDNPQELKYYADSLCGKKSDAASLVYKIIDTQTTIINSICENDDNEDSQSIQDAFSEFKQLKLLKFFEKHPECAGKIYENNNTPLLLAIKNFSGCHQDRLLIEFLLKQQPHNLFEKNNDGEDAFTSIYSFSKDPLGSTNNYKDKLFNLIRTVFSNTPINQTLIQKFSTKIERGKYQEALVLIKRNPALYYATFEENRDITFYLKKISAVQLDEDLQHEFDMIQQWAPLLKKQKESLFKKFRKTSETHIKKIDDTVRRFSITAFSFGDKQSKNYNKTFEDSNLDYQKKHFASSFTFGEKNKN